MKPETIRECLLRQARDFRTDLSRRLAAVTATYLEYEADRMGSEADEPCTSRRLCVNGKCHCLVNLHCPNPTSAFPANDAGGSELPRQAAMAAP